MRLALSIAAFLLLLSPSAGIACSCEPVDQLTLEDLYAAIGDSQLVFVGRVVDADSTSFVTEKTFIVEVDATLSGEHKETRHISSAGDVSSCAFRLPRDERSLFLPSFSGIHFRETGYPSVSLCLLPRQVVRDSLFIESALRTTIVPNDSWGAIKQAEHVPAVSVE